MDDHLNNLSTLCRVCGNKVQEFKKKNLKKPLKKSSTYAAKIKVKFNIDVTSDEVQRHPPFFCHLCYSNLFLPTPREVPNYWPIHPESGECIICKRAEANTKAGRPTSKHTRMEELEKTEEKNKEAVLAKLERLAETATNYPNINFITDDPLFVCKLCKRLLSRPVETPCDHVFCLSCLHNLFISTSSSCIVCHICQRNFSLKDIKLPKQYFIDVLQNLRVKCTQCRRVSWLHSTDEHDCTNPDSSIPVDEQIFRFWAVMCHLLGN